MRAAFSILLLLCAPLFVSSIEGRAEVNNDESSKEELFRLIKAFPIARETLPPISAERSVVDLNFLFPAGNEFTPGPPSYLRIDDLLIELTDGPLIKSVTFSARNEPSVVEGKIYFCEQASGVCRFYQFEHRVLRESGRVNERPELKIVIKKESAS